MKRKWKVSNQDRGPKPVKEGESEGDDASESSNDYEDYDRQMQAYDFEQKQQSMLEAQDGQAVNSQALVAGDMPEISGLSENKLAAMLLRRKQQDFKDREYDCDDEIKKEMLTYDDRLTFVNELDLSVFGTD